MTVYESAAAQVDMPAAIEMRRLDAIAHRHVILCSYPREDVLNTPITKYSLHTGGLTSQRRSHLVPLSTMRQPFRFVKPTHKRCVAAQVDKPGVAW